MTEEQKPEWEEELLYVLAAIGKSMAAGKGETGLKRIKEFISKLLAQKDAQIKEAVSKERSRILADIDGSIDYLEGSDVRIDTLRRLRKLVINP